MPSTLAPDEVAVTTNFIGEPTHVALHFLRWRVLKVRRRWQHPIRGKHYKLLLANGATETIFQDSTTRRWYRQPY